MMKPIRFALLFTCSAAVTSCMQASTATLVPMNEIAQRFGRVDFQYKDFGSRSGPVKVVLEKGEIMHGRFGPANRFNAIDDLASGRWADALGVGGRETIFVKATGTGTTLSCHGVAVFGHGGGDCRMSNGALYRLKF